MQTIGLIGGMSWESSSVYYQLINKKVNEILGGSHSCKSIMYSVDFEEIANLQHKNDWDTLAEIMIEAAKALQNAGADMVVICTNTMHKVAPQIESSIDIPILHIGDAAAEAIKKQGLNKVGLLGTKFTMEEDFLKNRIQNHGIEVIVPEESDRNIVHRVIYDELTKGIIKPSSRKDYLEIIDKLRARGAEGVILGCTEIGLLVKQSDTDIILFDTTHIHAEMSVIKALAS